MCEEFPAGSGKEHHSSLAEMCLDFRVPDECALLVSCLGFWAKASLEAVHGFY